MNINCPQCGFPSEFGSAKLSVCPSCSASILLDNASAQLSTLAVDLAPEPYLLSPGQSVTLNGREYTAQGYSLYQHADGSQVEWQLLDNVQATYYLNQEDESLFLVKARPELTAPLPAWESLQPNTHVQLNCDWLVVEQREIRFAAFGGKLIKLPQTDVTQHLSYLSNVEGECLVLSFNKVGSAVPYNAFQGWWIDPMDIER